MPAATGLHCAHTARPGGDAGSLSTPGAKSAQWGKWNGFVDDANSLKTSDFDYDLPQELIAQTPIEPRDASRLLVVHRSTGILEHQNFYAIGTYLRPGDLLIANQSRVLPARLLGHRAETGGAVEVLLLAERPDLGPDYWETLVRPGRRLREGAHIVFGDEDNAGMVLHAEILQQTEAGGRIVCFWVTGSHVAIERSEEIAFRDAPGRTSISMVRKAIERVGYMPLPPYIHEKLA